MLTFSASKTTTPKTRPAESELGFGKFFTDHVLVRFTDEPAAEAQVVVRAGEPFAAAWQRAAGAPVSR